MSGKSVSLGSRAFGLEVWISSDISRDTAWREEWPLGECHLPVGSTPRWADRAHNRLPDMSCTCRERFLLFVDIYARLTGSHMLTHVIPAEKTFGDENGSENGENGNEKRTGRQNGVARMTNKTISHVSCAQPAGGKACGDDSANRPGALASGKMFWYGCRSCRCVGFPQYSRWLVFYRGGRCGVHDHFTQKKGALCR